jgi:catalase
LQANGVVTSTNLRFGRKPCCPVGSDEYSLTVAANGPVLLQDAYLIEKLAHFVRERIPDHHQVGPAQRLDDLACPGA